MVRTLVCAWLIVTRVAASAWAQGQPTPAASAPAAAAQPAKPAGKSAPKTATAVKPREPMDTGPCQLGVVAAIDDRFAVQKIGVTVFGNELAEVPVDWGFNDIVVERVRAAAPAGTAVRRIAYPRGAFDRYYNPPETLFGNSRGDFVAIVQQIIGNAHCERYIVIAGFQGTSADTHQPIKGIGIVNQAASCSAQPGSLPI